MATAFPDAAQFHRPDPLDTIEQLMLSRGWGYERVGDEEITGSISGKWCEFHLRFFCPEEGRALQCGCMFDMRIPDAKRAQAYELLALVNERLWVGHFEAWMDDGVVMYRHASLLDEFTTGVSPEVLETLVDTAINECERYYPAFQFVLWAGRSPKEAMETALLEPVGEA